MRRAPRAHRRSTVASAFTFAALTFASPALTATPLAAQQSRGQLSLERIFSTRDFAGDFFGPARWLADGSGYTTVERSPIVRGLDIVHYEPETGRREVIVSARQLVPPGSNAPLIIENYQWSGDDARLLIYTNSKRVWRAKSRGDYWVLDLESGALHKLGGDAEESTLQFAKFSPEGDRVGYVREHDIYVERLSDGEITRLTDDGSESIINGTFDWAYEEEFGIRDGFRWSPDGTHIAYWQLDQSGVKEFLLINDTDSLYPKITSIPYPKVGETLSSAKVGVVPAGGGPTVWADVPGEPRNNYIARMEWAANSDEVVIQHLNRAQNTNDLVLIDAATGASHTMYTDRDDAWVNVVDDMLWMDDGARFTWVSEKDGWRHVYVVSRDGSGETLVTPWEMDVISVELIDDEGGWLYFIASPENRGQRYLFRSRLDGSGEPERLTPTSDAGWNSYQLSADGAWGFQTHSAFGVPATVELVALPEHRRVRTMMANEKLTKTVESLDRGDVEFFQIEVEDGLVLDGWLMKPPDFDPNRKYPLLFTVYGEPAAQTVVDRWGGRNYLWHSYLTQQGYLVASVDNRGTPAPRGREWRKSVYGEIGTLGSEDQAAANRVIRAWDFVDADRIGIWGWSGGGSSTLNMMFRYPELYSTGMAVAPVPDQLLYDAIYQERYSGTLPEHAKGYKNGSPISHVDGLKGNLLLVHGTGDDNVHYQGSERLINVMIAKNKAFTMMAYPNRSHGIFEGEGTTRHLYELLTRYLREHMPPGARVIS
jgi:dipeptidyl-peptidase 4